MKLQYLLLLIFCCSISFISCDKNNNSPLLLNEVDMNILIHDTDKTVRKTFTSIEVNGEVATDNSFNIEKRGLCYSTSPNPTIYDNKTIESGDVFTAHLKGLTSGTRYYIRAYAETSSGVSYSDEISIKTYSLQKSTWDFQYVYSEEEWGTVEPTKAVVTFYEDGSAEFNSNGISPIKGRWEVNENSLTYQLSEGDNKTYIFTGTLDENTISGTFTLTDPWKPSFKASLKEVKE